MTGSDLYKRALAAAIAVLGLAASAAVGPGSRGALQAAWPQSVKEVVVPAEAGWVDTGVEVAPGDEVLISAYGEISLQRGNPAASCGPEGLDVVTVDQPVPDVNLGALIGKVAQLVSVRQDQDTGAEIRDEIFVVFFVGPERALSAPTKGRLYLGVNENVLKDNGGAFTVRVFRRPA